MSQKSRMAPKPDPQSLSTAADSSAQLSIDPFFHILKFVPYSFLRPPRLRLKLPSFSLPSAMTVFSLILLTYFMVVSGFIYDVIVEPPGIGSTQDPATGAVRPVVFLSGRVNGQYIIEGLSSGFMFVLGGIGIVLLDLALDKNRARSIKVSYSIAGISSIVIAYVMTTLFIRIKIPVNMIYLGKEVFRNECILLTKKAREWKSVRKLPGKRERGKIIQFMLHVIRCIGEFSHPLLRLDLAVSHMASKEDNIDLEEVLHAEALSHILYRKGEEERDEGFYPKINMDRPTSHT
ncbi:hypothetical protein GQ457_16G005590 [Hibiscus cannabinus]